MDFNGSDSKALAERLMQIERPAHGTESLARDVGDNAERIDGAAPDCTRRAADTGQIGRSGRLMSEMGHKQSSRDTRRQLTSA
jgi:hypothetical protein